MIRFKKYNTDSGGYIAIISVLILSAVLLSMASSLSTSSYFTRYGIVDYESKERSFHLARSCVEQAMLKFVKNSNYPGDETVNVKTSTCNISAVTGTPPFLIYTASATVNGSTTTLEIDINNSDMDILSLTEI